MTYDRWWSLLKYCNGCNSYRVGFAHNKHFIDLYAIFRLQSCIRLLYIYIYTGCTYIHMWCHWLTALGYNYPVPCSVSVLYTSIFDNTHYPLISFCSKHSNFKKFESLAYIPICYATGWIIYPVSSYLISLICKETLNRKCDR